MLQKNSVIVFCDEENETCDGMPTFTVMMHNLKDLIESKKVATKTYVNTTNKPKLDQGIVKKRKSEKDS